MELLKILREIELEFEGVMSPADWQRDANIAIASIYKMKNIKIYEEPSSSVQFLADSLDVLRTYPGAIKRVGDHDKHDGIHPMDALHILMAKRLGCTEIATFDRDFDETSREIPPIILNRDPW